MKHHHLLADQRGMAMAIVLVASFAVLAIVGAGAAMLANNLDKASGRGDRQIAEANAVSGSERVQGLQAADGRLTDACSAGDCINTLGGGCGPCVSTIYSSGTNRHQAEILSLTHPLASGVLTSDPVAGDISVRLRGFYQNVVAERDLSMCLNYCSVAGRNCGADGCNGSCGTCVEPATCGGGGEAGVCGTVTSCSDIAIECADSCVNGDICGGGTVIDADNNIVGIPGGCQDETGAKCNEIADSITKVWDNDGDYDDTGATDVADGRNNSTALATETNTNFEAVKFCDDISWSGFSNWYLPAQNELDLLSSAVNNGWITNISDGSCYWSSTDTAGATAYAVGLSAFGVPTPCDQAKSNTYYVRCIRRY